MYQRSDGKMTGNMQQGRHFDRMRGVAKEPRSGDGGMKSKEGHPQGPAELGGDEHETQAHPVTGAHEVHIKHHGDGHFTVHTFHTPIGPHPNAHEATVSHHDGAADAHAMAQTHFPANDGDETGEDDGETLSGITGGMPGSNDENPKRRGY